MYGRGSGKKLMIGDLFFGNGEKSRGIC